ncbi:putative serine protease EDA2 [Cladorrhinum samala]|uniref:Serine protease EDA2 n=1 Tax=Cladorrhinum samala TaxID=585594 RepID=A0AAV9HJ00_9PEZI|nr:putative serine protease EDA2 [Cladorrhinum samala]
MKTLATFLVFMGIFSAHVQALAPLPPKKKVVLRPGPNGGNTTFDQLIDHSNPSLGTFPQRYWWNTTYWGGLGFPQVIFNTPGESAGDFYGDILTNETLPGLYAQAVRGAVVMLEHRYWGKSSPYQVLDTQNLTHLTLKNSIDDVVRFARTVRLPFDRSGRTNAPRAPWVMAGFSYSGALAAWINKLSPGTFWAYHASSAPVEAIHDFWQYWEPVRKGMPQNCSNDMILIADHVDKMLESDSETEIRELKAMFGLEDLQSQSDFASYWDIFPSPIARYDIFYQMCDSIQGVRPVELDPDVFRPSTYTPTPIDPEREVSADGVGLQRALGNYAEWFTNEFLPLKRCQGPEYSQPNNTNSVECLVWDNATNPKFTDLSVDNPWNRQWIWMVCNEPFFYFQTAAPPGHPSLSSRANNAEYYDRLCRNFFPSQRQAKSSASNGRTAEALNAMTDGWFVNTTRLLWVNGEFDPWRSASVSSEFRPGGPLQSTDDTPVYLIKGARHCNDLFTWWGERNQEIGLVQQQAVAKMSGWVKDFYNSTKRHQAGWAW